MSRIIGKRKHVYSYNKMRTSDNPRGKWEKVKNDMVYINGERNHIVAFIIRKEMECNCVGAAEEQIRTLTELQEKKDTFGDIKIPDFTFGRDDNFVWYEADYIKGDVIQNKWLYDTLWKECVLRKDSFTLSNYGYRNFIRCPDTKEIYYIDLSDCRHMTMKERENAWNRNYQHYLTQVYDFTRKLYTDHIKEI